MSHGCVIVELCGCQISFAMQPGHAEVLPPFSVSMSTPHSWAYFG